MFLHLSQGSCSFLFFPKESVSMTPVYVSMVLPWCFGQESMFRTSRAWTYQCLNSCSPVEDPMSDPEDSPSSSRIRSMCFKWWLMDKNGAFQFHIQKYLSMPGFHLLLPGLKVSTSLNIYIYIVEIVLCSKEQWRCQPTELWQSNSMRMRLTNCYRLLLFLLKLKGLTSWYDV